MQESSNDIAITSLLLLFGDRRKAFWRPSQTFLATAVKLFDDCQKPKESTI